MIVRGAEPRRGGRPPAPPGRGPAAGRQRHRQPARPRPDPERPGRPRDGPVRRRRAAVFLRGRDGQHGRRGQPRPVADATSPASATPGPLACRRPRSPPAGRCSRSTTATTRAAATSGRRSSRRASTRCCTRRSSTAPSSSGLLNVYHDRPHQWPADELDDDGAAGDAGQRRHPDRPGLRADGGLGGPAPVDPAARRPAESASSTCSEIGHRDRHRAPPAHRLPQRPGLPARRRRPHPGRDAGPGRRVHRRDARPAAGRRRRGDHRLGRRAPGRPEPADDAADDPRANTIPGTEDDLDESMLLAPMVYEDAGPRRPRALQARPAPVHATTTCGCSSSTRASRPRRWPTPTRPSGCAASRTRSSASCAASGSCCRSPSRSSRPSTSARCWSRSRSGWVRSSRATTSRSRSWSGRPACSCPSPPAASTPSEYLAPWEPGETGHRDLGRGAQRAGAHRGRAHRPAGQPLPGDGRRRRQPDRRAAARPRAARPAS